MFQNKHKNRFLSAFILFFLLVQLFEVPLSKAASFQSALIETASAQGTPEASKRFGIIAILVEAGLMDDQNSYPGLNADYPDKLKNQTLPERIRRYAIDAQSSQEFTKSIILKTPKDTRVEDIVATLERLYQQGDGTAEEINQLRGVVAIGEVPLPVVNKRGNHFVSMFPYTDFEDKAYIFDSASGDFIPNPDLKFAKAEVWHGVIKPPAQAEGEAAKSLAEYFDKNHLYHADVPEFAAFDKKIFLADLFNEFKLMKKFKFGNYLNYINYLADFSYLRFNKKLAEKLYSEAQQKLTEDGVNLPGAPATTDSFKALPDIQSRSIVMNFVSRYVELFDKFLSANNEWADFTGRYDAVYKDQNDVSRSDIHTLPALISIKDDATMEYLHQVNDALEKKIDEYAIQLQQPVSMLQKSKIKGTVQLSNANSFDLLPAEFVNFSLKQYLGGLLTLFIHGKPASSFKSIADCMLYRGSNDGSGKNSTLVQTLRTFNPKSAADQDPDYAGCSSENADHPERCFPLHAKKPVLDINGTKEVAPGTVPQSATDVRACFDFKEVNRLKEYETEVDDYLNKIKGLPTEELKKNVPLPGSPYQSPEKIVLFDDSGVKVTLADVLQKFGRGDNKDNDGDGTIDNAAEGDPKFGIPLNDWQQIGERLLQKNQVYFFKGNPFAGVQEMTLVVQPEAATDSLNTGTLSLPSITYHKEPTHDIHNVSYATINAQLKAGGIAQSLPIDNPRYVSFKDTKLLQRKIIYPDSFSAVSYDEFLASLQKKEQEIQDIAGQSGVNVSPNFLTNIVNGTSETYNQAQSELLKANSGKLSDALQWKTLNIDQKHQYVLEKYLGEKADPFIEKTKNGYEALYLVSNGSSGTFEMNFNGDIPLTGEDTEFTEEEKKSQQSLDEQQGADEGQDGKNSNEEAVFILQWFGEMLKWLNETTSKLSVTTPSQPMCGVDINVPGGTPEQSIPTTSTTTLSNDPATIEMQPESPIIKSSELATNKVQVRLKDEKGNLANNNAYELTFRSEGPCTLDTSKDENPTEPDVQISSLSGRYEVTITGTSTPGNITLKASLDFAKQTSSEGETRPPLTAQTTIQSRDDVKLALSASQTTLSADSKALSTIQASVVDSNGNLVENFSSKVQFSLSQNALGQIITSTHEVPTSTASVPLRRHADSIARRQASSFPNQIITGGKSSVLFKASNKAGNPVITATVSGFDPVSLTLTTVPEAASHIVLESPEKTLDINASSPLEMTAKLYDKNGNVASSDSTTKVSFKLTKATESFAQFEGPTEVQAKDGLAKIKLRATQKSGPVHVIASAAGLTSGTLELHSVMKFGAETIKNMAPRTLFASLLGADFGNLFQTDYLAGQFIFSGKGQSALSLLSDPKPKLRLAEIAPNGKVNVLAADRIQAQFLPGNDPLKPNRILLSDALSKEELAEIFLILSPQAKAKISDTLNPEEEGVYVERLETDDLYDFKQAQKAVSISKNGNEALRILDNGTLIVFNNDFAALLDDGNKNNFLSLKIVDRGLEVARIAIVSKSLQDAKKLTPDAVLDGKSSMESGVYMRPLAKDPQYVFAQTFLGSSSSNARGIALIDQSEEIEKNQAPGFNYASLESAPNEMGIGFSGDNKHMLLFAAGNSVGEANLPYSSEIGVVLGDPTVRLNPKINVSKTGFTTDIGQEIYFGDVPVQEMVNLDYNSDGFTDLLVSYEDGKIRLLQNNRAYPRFEDHGIFLDFPGGILSMAKADLNKDGQEDLILATKDSCRRGEVCVNVYENQNGNFVRKNLALKPFNEKNRVYMLRADDLNNDGYPDLLTSDDSGAIRVFFNKNGNIDLQGKLVGSLGLHIDQNANLKNELLVAYDGMPQNDPGQTSDDQLFKELPLQIEGTLDPDTKKQLEDLEKSASANDAFSFSSSSPQKQIMRSFIYVDADQALVTSEKRAKDQTEPFSSLAKGDKVEYTITLKNSSPKDLKNFVLSDVFPATMEVDPAGIRCNDCGQEKIQLVETGQSLRPYIIKGFHLPKGQSRTIVYNAIVKETPKVKITLGHNFSTAYKQDQFLDIAASPEGNTTGRMTYYYSLSQDPKTKEIVYGTYVSPPPTSTGTPTEGPLGDGVPNNDSLKETDQNGLPKDLVEYDNKQKNADRDQDGLPDSWDDISSGLSSAIDTINRIANTFKCGSGSVGACLPLPLNFAFLAPGNINIMGIPGGFDPGLPLFAAGIPSTIPVWPPSPYQSSVFRLYLSPTLTLGLGTAFCLGPYMGAQCFAVAIPPSSLGLASLCQSLMKDLDKVFAVANDIVKSLSNNTVISSGGDSANTGGRDESGGLSGSAALGNYQYKASVNTNIRIPGFPQVITKWFEDQTSEIINKLTDLPDFYFILPDVTTMVGRGFSKDSYDKKETLNLSTPNKILSYLNSLPLVEIESKEIMFKIPALSGKEIAKLKADLNQWLEDEKNEVERIKNLWKCGTDTQYQTLCDKLLIKTGTIQTTIEKNLQILDQYEKLPQRILEWKNVTAKYLYQIICYIDAIIQFTGGYIQKQQSRIELWLKAVRQVQEVLKSWKILLDLMVEYQESCDKCTTSRYTLMEFLLKIFAFIPSPPVIPFPKWPDIYMDLSEVRTGLKILWPEVKFMPEKIIFPKVPRLTLPDVPNVNVNLDLLFPQIPLLPELPNLPELPDLPALPLPSLPDVPPPPKIPSLPASLQSVVDALKIAVKILCLLRDGILPVPENALKSQIEQLTERPLSSTLPLDFATKLQLPSIQYDFADRLELKGTLNFQLDFKGIYDTVSKVADLWNGIQTNLVKQQNQQLKEAGQILNTAGGLLQNKADQATNSGDINVNVKKESAATRLTADELTASDASQPGQAEADMTKEQAQKILQDLKKEDPFLGSALKNLDTATQALTKDAASLAKENEKFEKDIHLKAGQKILSRQDPLLQRSLEELKHDISFEQFSSSQLPENLVALRRSLIAFANDARSLEGKLGEMKDPQQAGKLLAQASSLQKYLAQKENGEVRAVAETNALKDVQERPLWNDASETDEPNALTSFNENFQNDTTKQLRLLADLNLPPVPETPGADPAQTIPKGIYISNPDLQVSERLIDYTAEADNPSSVLLMDIDNDKDEEVIYSYGGNIYLKENYKSSPLRTYYGGDPQIKDLSELVPSHPAVNAFNIITSKHESVELSWAKAPSSTIAGYEISYGLQPEAERKNFKVAAIIEPAGSASADGSTEQGFVRLENIQGEVMVGKQQAQNGMTLNFDSKLQSGNGGSAEIRFANGAYLRLEPNQELLLKRLDDPENPSLKFALPNGFYYATIRPFDTTGALGTPTSLSLMSPSECGDNEPPTANGGPSERTVSLFKTLTIDASKSFDAEGKITAYFIDLDPQKDSDLDGDPTNDRNLGRDLDVKLDSNGDGVSNNELNDPLFTLGPYNSLADREVVLNVLDQSLNKGQQKILIHVTVPTITLDPESADSGKISGQIEPPDKDVPITIIRDRGGVKTPLTTKSAEKGKYLTDKDGKFSIDDLNLEDTVVIKNGQGQIIAEINPKTGRIVLKDDRYHVEVLPAEMPLLPTRIVVRQKSDRKIIATLFLVADLNTDTTIDAPDFPYNQNTVALFKGVHSKDRNTFDEFEWKKIPADDAVYPGATEILETASKKRVALLDSGGNFYVFDGRLSLRLKEAQNLDDPLIIEIVMTPTVVGEFHVSVKSEKGIQVLPYDRFKVFVEGAKEKGPLFDTDRDGMPDLWELTYKLNPKETKDALQDTDGDSLTNLEEYRAGTNPQNPDSDGDGYSDAQELVNSRDPNQKATSPFKDVQQNHPYYQSILNLFERHILDGIPTGNAIMFGPNEHIRRSEFSDIMLKIFCILPRREAYEAPPAFTDIPFSKNLPWYYAVTKEAYFQGFITGYKGEIDPARGKTPFKPDEAITVAEATKIILEALEKKGIISMGKITLAPGEPYYAPYLKIAQDLNPYLKQSSRVRKPFIITAAEAKNPEALLSRAGFVAMADRVLTAYDCSVIDDDKDGMPTFWENKNSLKPLDPKDAPQDPDQDDLKNLEEYRRGTNPHNPDTDAGGIKDGIEVKKATNPLNPKDDPFDSDGDGLTNTDEINKYKTDPTNKDTDRGGVNDGTEVLLNNTNPLNPRDDLDSDGDGLADKDESEKYKTDPHNPDTDSGGIQDGAEVSRGTDPLLAADDLIDPRKDLEEGIYVIQEQCLSCPCLSSIDHTADLIPGDLIFAILSNEKNMEIFSKSGGIVRKN
jgi:uncharacterized repeat protein (TIGR01451 family)